MRFSLILSLFFLLASPLASFGDEGPRVYLEAERSAFIPGEEIAVQVLLGSEDAVNVFDVQIAYSTSTLEFLALENDDSIVDVWVISQEKTTIGSVALGGGIVKGFEGERGKIATLVFRAKETGIANFHFTSANIYYADGKGTRAESLGFPLELEIGGEPSKISSRLPLALGSIVLLAFVVFAVFFFRRAKARKMLIIVSLAALGLPATAFGAATLSLDPATGTFAVGGTFSVSVLLDTGGADVNLVESSISFPPDKLEVVSPSGGKSVISIWTDTPKFDNSRGIISLQGGTPNPGINVRQGLVTSITFTVKAPGSATLSFSPASRVFLNDGLGTDVLGGTRRGTYNLVSGFPGGPVVISPTHSDGLKWYGSREASLRWQAEEGVKGYSYTLDDSPIGIPDDISEGLSQGVDYSGLEDGTYYFHVKSLKGGAWGGATDFRFQIDTTAPEEFFIQITPSKRTSERQPFIYFETTDSTSGIDKYELAIVGAGEVPSADAFSMARSPYIPLDPLPLGRHTVIVKAFDRAGNVREARQELEIVKPVFEIVSGVGIRFGSNQISFRTFFVGLGILLVLLGQYAVLRIRAWRRRVHGEENSHFPPPSPQPPSTPLLPAERPGAARESLPPPSAPADKGEFPFKI